jgi:hypothetical protein
MIFTNEPETDFFSIMALIESFSSEAKVTVKEDKLFSLTQRMHIEFPCIGGIEKANVFKKASAFLCEFISEEMITKFNFDCIDKIKKIPNYESIVIGLYIVTTFLKGATVGSLGNVIQNPIELSEHSYIDIVDALRDASLNNSFRLIAVLLEQLVYKTNPKLQRKLFKLN